MEQREAWNILAPEWRRLRPHASRDAEEFLDDAKGLILDVGCGTGRNLMKGKRYVAFDFAEKQAEFAKEKAERDGTDASVAVAAA